MAIGRITRAASSEFDLKFTLCKDQAKLTPNKVDTTETQLIKAIVVAKISRLFSRNKTVLIKSSSPEKAPLIR